MDSVVAMFDDDTNDNDDFVYRFISNLWFFVYINQCVKRSPRKFVVYCYRWYEKFNIIEEVIVISTDEDWIINCRAGLWEYVAEL